MLESPDVWIITDGRNAGVSKLIAGIMDEIRSADQDEYTVPVIGIVPWKSLTTESDKRKSKSEVIKTAWLGGKPLAASSVNIHRPSPLPPDGLDPIG